MLKIDRIKHKIFLVTGASSGVGENISRRLADAGAIVYGAARHLPAPYAASSGTFHPMIMDVTDNRSVAACVSRIREEAGDIDVLINCAGSGIAGALEDCSPEEMLQQFDVNTIGALRTTQAVLPGMRQRRQGIVINIGSIGGDFALPYQGLYTMSKAALRKATECLRLEVAPFGIQAAIIEPGDMKTGFTAARIFSKQTNGSIYEEGCKRAVAQMAHDEQTGHSPDCVTNAVIKLLGKRQLPACVAVGGIYQVFPFLNRILPYCAIEAILKRMYHV